MSQRVLESQPQSLAQLVPEAFMATALDKTLRLLALVPCLAAV